MRIAAARFLAALSFVAAAGVSTALPAGAQEALPPPNGRINDFAGVLDEAARIELAALSAAVDTETTAEIAVATVTSLSGMSVEEYAVKLFAAWGIGKRGKDNGVLVLVAPTEREMRIEVGYGLEPILPDGLAGVIVRDQFLPPFRDGNYQAGIVAGVRRVADIVRRNQPPTERERRAYESRGGIIRGVVGLLFILTIAVIVAGGGGYAFGLGLGARIVLYFACGLVILALGVGMAIRMPIPLAVLLGELAVFGGFAWHGFRSGRQPEERERLRGSGAARTSAWMSSPAASDSHDSSGGSSGSDFGGGSSGGGGASGRW